MIVVDASAAVDLVLDGDAGRAVGLRIGLDELWLAPDIVDFEVVAAIRRMTLGDQVSENIALFALDEFFSLTFQRIPTATLARRAFELRSSVATGDALYVALAEIVECPLITTDGRLARSHGHDADIEFVA